MTLVLAIYAAVVATGAIGWQVYSYLVKTKTDRRERASGVVGGVLSFLYYVDPETGLVGAIPAARVQDAITDYANRWDGLRDQLEALRVAHPSADVEAKAQATIDAVDASLAYSFWAMREGRAMSEREWENLKTKYAAAKTAAQELKRVVQTA